MITAHFEHRDFTPYEREHWTKLIPVKYSQSVFGGSKRAVIRAEGARADLWEFVEMLRCPVYLKDQSRAKNVWWGYVNKVTIHEASYSVSVSLDDMANRIAIAYTYQNERFTTAWAQDTDSDSEYGQKDLLLTAREKSEAMALQFRSTELENRKYPVPSLSLNGKSRDDLLVQLDCEGWMSTLDWQYYAEDEGNEIYEDFGQGEREIGEDDRPNAAQGFQLSSAGGWTANTIWLRVRKIGSPTDNFLVALYSDSGTAPNAELSGTDDIAGTALTDQYDWYEFTLDTPQALSISTLYWIHCSRSTGIDASNFYMIDANKDQGYANGNLYIQKTSDSSWYDKKMDALFRVVGEEATTTQITNIITAAGEFFLGTTIEDVSGVNSTQYRAGDQTALYEVLELLKAGTTNSRRLLAEVTEIRKLRVFEEPPKYEGDYTLSINGEIRDANDNKVPPSECVVGVWMKLKDFIPSTANISKLANPSPVFVEESEYDVINERYSIKKTRSSVSAAGSLAQGIGIG
jgi:hypothetical protein